MSHLFFLGRNLSELAQEFSSTPPAWHTAGCGAPLRGNQISAHTHNEVLTHMCVRVCVCVWLLCTGHFLSRSCSRGSDIAEKRCFLFISALSVFLSFRKENNNTQKTTSFGMVWFLRLCFIVFQHSCLCSLVCRLV